MMKTAFLLIMGFVLLNPAHSQLSGNGPSISHSTGMSGPPVAPRDLSAYQNVVNINGSDGFYVHRDLFLDYFTVINGQQVLGVPYLSYFWSEGTITTPDGRVYTDYKIKYNVQNQTLTFLNGTDSMDANEEIREFTLKNRIRDSLITSRFVNSNQYQKGKTVYYEVIVDNERGQLLKLNSKEIKSNDSGLLSTSSNTTSTKYLDLQATYYYYDKKTKKISRIRPNNNMASVLNLSEQQAADLGVDSYDVTNEADLIRLMKAYFEKAKLKGF